MWHKGVASRSIVILNSAFLTAYFKMSILWLISIVSHYDTMVMIQTSVHVIDEKQPLTSILDI